MARSGLHAALLSILLAAALGHAAPPETLVKVWVSENGSSYHRADCPRLHFGREMAASEASAQLAPCAVCKPELATTILGERVPVMAVAAPEALATVPAPAHEPVPRPRTGRGAGRWIGLGIGIVVGFFGGGAIGAFTGEDYFIINETGLWVGGTIGAALAGTAGYALGGGFRARLDATLERDRRELNLAAARLPPAVTAGAPGLAPPGDRP